MGARPKKLSILFYELASALGLRGYGYQYLRRHHQADILASVLSNRLWITDEITPSGSPYELEKKATYKPIIQSVPLPRSRLVSKKKRSKGNWGA